MSDFLYFLEGRKSAGLKSLAELGLGYAFESDPTSREVIGGPDKFSGCVIGSDPQVEFSRERQTWQAWGGEPGSRTWIGYDNEKPPTSADLTRREMIDGYALPLGIDGPGGESKWWIPLGRVFPSGTKFPQALSIGIDGKLVREPLKRFLPVCRLADRFFAILKHEYERDEADTEKPEPINDEEAFGMACEIIAVNYRVGPREISMLKLITDTNIKFVLGWFVDLPTFLQVRMERAAAIAKKNGAAIPDGDSSSSGEAAG